jgi:hypothetical protein
VLNLRNDGRFKNVAERVLKSFSPKASRIWRMIHAAPRQEWKIAALASGWLLSCGTPSAICDGEIFTLQKFLE